MDTVILLWQLCIHSISPQKALYLSSFELHVLSSKVGVVTFLFLLAIRSNGQSNVTLKAMYVLHIITKGTISVQCRAVLSWVYNVNVVTFLFSFGRQEKKEEIWLSIMTKAPTPTEKIQKATWQDKNAIKTTIADRLRTVSWINNSNLTGVVKQVYEHPAFPLSTRYNFCSVSSFGILNL